MSGIFMKMWKNRQKPSDNRLWSVAPMYSGTPRVMGSIKCEEEGAKDPALEALKVWPSWHFGVNLSL